MSGIANQTASAAASRPNATRRTRRRSQASSRTAPSDQISSDMPYGPIQGIHDSQAGLVPRAYARRSAGKDASLAVFNTSRSGQSSTSPSRSERPKRRSRASAPVKSATQYST